MIDMDVSKNSGIPKWMVKIRGKPYEQMDDLGGKNHPYFLIQHPYCITSMHQASLLGIKMLPQTLRQPQPLRTPGNPGDLQSLSIRKETQIFTATRWG